MKTLTALPAFALAICAANPALADISVEEAYDQIIKLMQLDPKTKPSVGNVLRSDGMLVANDIAISVKEDDIEVTVAVPSITFKDLGDGSVEVRYAETMPIRFAGTGPDGDFVADLEFVQTDTFYVLSGTAENTNYAYTAPNSVLRVVNVESPDNALAATGEMVLTGGSGTYAVTMDQMINMDMTFRFDNVTLDLDFMDKSLGERVNFAMNLAGFDGGGSFAIPEDLSTMDEENPFAEGMAIDLKYSFDSMAYNLDLDLDGEKVQADVKIGAGDLEMVLNANQVVYRTGLKDMDISMLVPDELPFPINVAAKEMRFDLAMPIGKNVRGDFEFGTALRDLSIDEALVNMVDPGAIMPRDPITFAFNLSGQAMLYYNLFDPKEAAAMERADIPGEIYNLTLNELDIRAVGASLMGDGAFTFDNDDFTTIPGMPRPEGKLSLQAAGVNGLIDRLIQMGIIQDGDAMGARMMMGLFASPGDGEDTLISTIEVNEQGQVLANGQRLR